MPSSPASMRKNRTPYWRDVAAVLSMKAFALGLIYLLCFGPANSIDPSPAAMFRHFASPVTSGDRESAHD